jgi:hypothetical protein
MMSDMLKKKKKAMVTRIRGARVALALVLSMIAGTAFTPRQSSLDAAASAFASAWRSRDAGAVVQNVAPEGVRLTFGREAHPVMPARQARAAVDDFLATHSSGQLAPQGVKSLGGSPEAGSAEFSWQTVASGTSESLSYRIFVSFTKSGNAWRITQIIVS